MTSSEQVSIALSRWHIDKRRSGRNWQPRKNLAVMTPTLKGKTIMLKRILEALGALLEDTPVFNRLIDQMKQWGETQETARSHLISVLSNVVASFELAHAIVLIELSRLSGATTSQQYKEIATEKIDRNKLYELFKVNDICSHIHQLH